MDPNDESLPRLSCPRSIGTRYRALRTVANSTENGKIQYLFALDLYQVQALLPTLLGSVVQVIRFLGPERCALSVVEGRSTDATYAILEGVREEVERLGATVYLNTSDVDPMGGSKDRMESLAELRNQALAPFVEAAHLSTSDAAVVFLNDVSICAHDILELVYQHRKQQAHMTCGMDWSEQGAIFYDIYVARSLVGETFWQIAQDGLWHFSGNLFWADLEAKSKYERLQPFQVYACWNGGAVIDAAPLLQRQIQFRGSREGECYMGEPTLFCKDLWRLHRGRIQVIPTVNVGYDNEATEKIKDLRGRVEDKIDTAREELQAELVEWQAEPPSLVKCMREFAHPYWVPST
ncbi:MAG: hypothetical protein M1832_004703 [Thelocarpon impressellum]|nr:MAG: hypothetical protein M1832_004703 [Thelocarpon impressellum]